VNGADPSRGPPVSVTDTTRILPNFVRPSPDGRSAVLWPMLALVLCFLAGACWNIHRQTIENPDEPRYAAPARTMLRSGDWIVPQFDAKPRLTQPILYYWLVAGAGKVGELLNVSLGTSFRFASLSMALLTVIATCLLGREILGTRGGFIAAAVLMTTFFFHQSSRQIVSDMTLSAMLLWAWLFAWIALRRLDNDAESESPHDSSVSIKKSGAGWPLLGFYLCMGLACMTQGLAPVAVFLLIPLLAYLFWASRLSDLLRAGLWWGVPLALGVGLWWWVLLYQRGFENEVKAYFLMESAALMTGGTHAKPIPFLFYIQILAGNLFPWNVIVPGALYWSWKRSKEAPPMPIPLRDWDNAKLLFCALVIPFILLGVMISKRPLYILPLYPLLSIWLAWAWLGYLNNRPEGVPAHPVGVATVLSIAVLVLCMAALPLTGALPKIFTFPIHYPEQILFTVFCGFIALLLGLAAQTLRSGLRYKASLQLLAAAMGLAIGIETVILPSKETYSNREPFYRELCAKLAGRPFYSFSLNTNEAVWYLDRSSEGMQKIKRPELKASFFEKRGTLILVSQRDLKLNPDLAASIRVVAELRERRWGESYFLIEPHPQRWPAPSVFEPRKK